MNRVMCVTKLGHTTKGRQYYRVIVRKGFWIWATDKVSIVYRDNIVGDHWTMWHHVDPAHNNWFSSDEVDARLNQQQFEEDKESGDIKH